MRKILSALMLLILLPCAVGERKEHMVLLKVRLLEAKAEEKNRLRTLLLGQDVNMVVSWYGPGFQGRKRADGRRYNMYDARVAAHKMLPLGTKLKLENPENGKKLIVFVRDRGPYWRRRDLDLSFRAAQKLGIVKEGVAILKVTIISLPKGPD